LLQLLILMVLLLLLLVLVLVRRLLHISEKALKLRYNGNDATPICCFGHCAIVCDSTQTVQHIRWPSLLLVLLLVVVVVVCICICMSAALSLNL
jgi:hypothetical protein